MSRRHRRATRQASVGDEQLAQRVEGLEALPRPQGHALEGRVDQVHGHGRLVGQPAGHAPQQRPPADQMDALEDDVLGQLGGRFAQAPHGGGDDLAHLVLDGARAARPGDRTTVLGMPVISSRPRTSAFTSPL